jgi:uncharacterized repeat protein (TIGR04076 family)
MAQANDPRPKRALPLVERAPRRDAPVTCTAEVHDYETAISSCQHLCKYYRHRPEQHAFDGAPKGLCPHLFMAAYPFALGLLYGATYPSMVEENEMRLACPSVEPNVRFSIVRELRSTARRAFDLLKAAVARPFTKIDRIEYRVFFRIDAVVGDGCAKHHFVDQRFEFNTGGTDEQCPAVFANIYPTTLALSGGGHARWTDDATRFSFSCPDNESDVTFRVEAKPR